MVRLVDRTGQTYGRLFVVKRGPNNKRGQAQWWCRCSCGNPDLKLIFTGDLQSGNTKSCGCLAQENRIKTNTIHGMFGTKEYEIWLAAKNRSRRKKLPFNLTPEDIKIPDLCPALGTKLEANTWTDDSKGAQPNSPTLDRVIPEKGYVKGNVAIISHKANLIKNNGTLDELKAVACWLRKLLKEQEKEN